MVGDCEAAVGGFSRDTQSAPPSGPEATRCATLPNVSRRRFDLTVFDLDGTLIDSKRDLAESVNATRAYAGLPPLAPETVYSYVGNGAPVLIRRAMGPDYSEEEIGGFLEFFIRYYHDHCLDHTALYPGMRDCLEQLRAADVQLAVLTNKPVRISQAIVDGLGLGAYFFRVYGGNSFASKKPDPEGLLKLVMEADVPLDRVLMVGDSSVDIHTAVNAGVASLGVTYGLQPETLRFPTPTFLVDSPAGIPPIVRGA